jgi:hypothetical protein
VSGSRRGSIIGATWLIGLGVLFLVRQATDTPWSQAWPMFIILAGVATLVVAVLDRRPGIGSLWDLTWPIASIVIGAILLAGTTGRLGESPTEIFTEYWPCALVAFGIWFVIGAFIPGPTPVETLAIPLDGAPTATVRVSYGAGRLTTRPAATGLLVDGDFRGGVVHQSDGPGHVKLSQDTSAGLPWLERDSDWTIGLARDVPLDLRLDVGAARATLDFAGLRLRRLELHTGASETRVRLPADAGLTEVRTESGAASLTIEVPAGVAARIKSRIALGSSQIDEARFPKFGDLYESPDYGSAENRVDIDAQGGVGSLRVIGTD